MWSQTNPCGNQQEKPWFATGILMDIWESQVTSTHRNQKSVSLGEAWLEETSIRRWLFHFFLVAPVNVSQALVSLIIWHSISCIEVSNICWENGCQNLLLLFICLLVSLKIACTDGAVIRPAWNFRETEVQYVRPEIASNVPYYQCGASYS